MGRYILDANFFRSPFYTVRALYWNIRTLGFIWWLRCLAQNIFFSLSEQLGRLRLKQEPVRLAARAVRRNTVF